MTMRKNSCEETDKEKNVLAQFSNRDLMAEVVRRNFDFDDFIDSGAISETDCEQFVIEEVKRISNFDKIVDLLISFETTIRKNHNYNHSGSFIYCDDPICSFFINNNIDFHIDELNMIFDDLSEFSF